MLSLSGQARSGRERMHAHSPSGEPPPLTDEAPGVDRLWMGIAEILYSAGCAAEALSWFDRAHRTPSSMPALPRTKSRGAITTAWEHTTAPSPR